MNASIASIRWKPVIAAALVSCAFALAAFALSLQEIADKGFCDQEYNDCMRDNCEGVSGIAAIYNSCKQDCTMKWIACYKKHGLFIPKNGPAGPVQQISPPPESNPNKPRPGPGQTVPPNKSHPTPTPRKGPGNISGLPKSSPTPSATKPPVLLAKPSATPHPSPKKSGHH